MRRRLLMALAVAAPFALAAWGSARLARASGEAIGGAVASAAAAIPAPGQGLLDPPHAREQIVDPADAAAVVAFEDLPDLDADPASASAPSKTGKKKPSSTTKKPARGLRVSAATVLRLANRGIRPSGSPVAATDEHPAGLALQGVSGLGVGLHDGDILTQCAGAPASSTGAVIGAVLAARQRRAPAMSGVVYRGAEKIALYVEMPYPK